MLPARRSGLETRVVDDEVVILDVANGKVHRLNATATRIWNDCDGSTAPSDMARGLAADFGGAPTDVLGDVIEALRLLQQLGLLRADADGSSQLP